MAAAGRTPAMATAVIRAIDADGFARIDDWSPGDADIAATGARHPPEACRGPGGRTSTPDVRRDPRPGATPGEDSAEADLARLFQARGDDYHLVCEAADRPAQARERRHRLVRREPEHQLHQHLLLPLPVLRVLQGEDEREPARHTRTTWAWTKSCAASRGGMGARARPKSACRAASTRSTPARPT